MCPRPSSMCGSTRRVMRTSPSTLVSSIRRSSSSFDSSTDAAAESEPRVVDEDVDAAQSAGRRRDEGSAARLVGDVEGCDLVAFAGKLLHELFEAVCPPRAEGEAGAGRGEGARRLGPDSARGACDDGGAIRQLRHVPEPTGLLADCGVHQRGEVRAGATARESDQVAEERSVDPLAARVRCEPGELEQLVGLRLGELEALRALTRRFGQPVASLTEPLVHAASLVRVPLGGALHFARHEGRRPQGDRFGRAASRPRAGFDASVSPKRASRSWSSRVLERRPGSSTRPTTRAARSSSGDAFSGVDAVGEGAAAVRRRDRQAARRPDPDRAFCSRSSTRDLVRALAERARDGLLDGLDPAHHPRAADGRALVAEHGLRLQGRAPRRRAPARSSSRC